MLCVYYQAIYLHAKKWFGYYRSIYHYVVWYFKYDNNSSALHGNEIIYCLGTILQLQYYNYYNSMYMEDGMVQWITYDTSVPFVVQKPGLNPLENIL